MLTPISGHQVRARHLQGLHHMYKDVAKRCAAISCWQVQLLRQAMHTLPFVPYSRMSMATCSSG